MFLLPESIALHVYLRVALPHLGGRVLLTSLSLRDALQCVCANELLYYVLLYYYISFYSILYYIIIY